MSLYRYRHRDSLSHCGSDEFDVEQPWAADALLGCPDCGLRVYRTIGRVNFQFRHGMKGDCHDYREDMARFPRDPQAYVDGPAAVRKLRDRRLREGWVEGPRLADMATGDNGNAVRPAEELGQTGRPLIEACYEAAKKTGFSLDDPDVKDIFDRPERGV